MSKRQQIIDAIIARMQLIKLANGYQTDLGNNVNDFKTRYDEDDLPGLSVCDTIANHELASGSPTATNQIDTMSVQLRVFVSDDTPAQELRTMIADIWKAIKVDPRWGSLAMQTIPKRSGIVIESDAFQIGGAAVEIEISIFNTNFGS